jgi:hypothetical protein
MGVINGNQDGFEDDEYRFRECYEFNTDLHETFDDERCIHCYRFLTLSCPHIDEFIDEEEGE